MIMEDEPLVALELRIIIEDMGHHVCAVVDTEADAVREAVRASGIDPPGDVHASAEYRRHLAEVVAMRAVAQASKRARE